MARAFKGGQADGREWVRDEVREATRDDKEFAAEDVERGLSPGKYSADEGLINALTPEQLYEYLGLSTAVEWGGSEWRRALDAYNAGFAAGAREEIAG